MLQGARHYTYTKNNNLQICKYFYKTASNIYITELVLQKKLLKTKITSINFNRAEKLSLLLNKAM